MAVGAGSPQRLVLHNHAVFHRYFRVAFFTRDVCMLSRQRITRLFVVIKVKRFPRKSIVAWAAVGNTFDGELPFVLILMA